MATQDDAAREAVRAGQTPDEVTIGPWIEGMPSGYQESAAALLDRVRAVDGRAPEIIPGADDVVLPIVAPAGLVGLAWRPRSEGNILDPAELYIDPDCRGRGLGYDAARQVLATGPVWAHGTSPAAVRIAARLAAEPVRELLQLRRDPPVGEAPRPVEMPTGSRLRTFQPGRDDAGFLAVNARAFAWHPEQGRMDQAALDGEMAQSWFDPAGFFVAVDTAGTILGFHWTKVHREGATPMGEVYVLGVDPESPVSHLGTPLLAAGLNHLDAQQLDTLLYVEGDNARALRLYERYGFRRHTVDTVFEKR